MKWEKLHPKGRKIFWQLVLLVIVLRNSAFAYGAEETMSRIRIGTASDKFKNAVQLAAAFNFSAPRFLHARCIEFAVGSVSTSIEREAFISLGPVWRVPAWNETVFLDFGFSPTLLSGSSFNGRNLGGRFHFTSSLSIGANLGRDRANSIALRVQHTSNGGLDTTNPGLDIVALEFAFSMPE